MVPIQEMMAWTADDAHEEIVSALPPGVSFDVQRDHGLWTSSLRNAEDIDIWASTPSADLRIALIEAYVWLHIGNKEPTGPHWGRRTQDPIQVTAKVGSSADIPDPDDLNPSEIEALYSKPR